MSRIHAVITVQQPSTGAGVYFGEEMTVRYEILHAQLILPVWKLKTKKDGISRGLVRVLGQTILLLVQTRIVQDLRGARRGWGETHGRPCSPFGCAALPGGL